MLVIDLGFSYRVSEQKEKESLFATLVSDAIAMFLLIMGRFFA